MIWWILLAAALVAAVAYAVRKRPAVRKHDAPARWSAAPATDKSATPKRVKAPSEAIDNYRGAMLFPQKDSCEAVLKLRGRTFPEADAPAVPVPGCDRATCGCQVHHVVGRRRGPRRLKSDRRDDVRFRQDRRLGADRRTGADTWKHRP